jgi:hypothetical protein
MKIEVINNSIVCKGCNIKKNVSFFRIRNLPSGNKSYQSSCVECEHKRDALYRLRTKRKTCKRPRTSSSVLANLITNSRRRAKQKNIEHNITSENIKTMFSKQGGLCALTGIPMTFELNQSYVGKRQAPPNRCSIDRIDNAKGYTLGNIQLTCDFVNRFRNYLTIDDFVSCCILVAEKYKSQVQTGRLLTTLKTPH